MFSGLFNWLIDSKDSCGIAQPSFNIDGTPMVGTVDLHGNPFGVTSHDSYTSMDSTSIGGCDFSNGNFSGSSMGSSWD